MRTLVYAFPEFSDRPLRTKTFNPADLPSFADPNWPALALPPGAVRITVDGAAAGDWTIAPTPVAGARYPDGTLVETPDPIVFEVTAEDDDQTEDELRALLVAAIGTALAPGPLYRWYSAVFEDPADPAAMYLVPRPDAPYHTLVLTPTGGTLTAEPEDIYPIVLVTSNVRGHDAEGRTELDITLVPLDEDGVPVPNDTDCEVSFSVVRAVELHARYEGVNVPPPQLVAKRSAPETLSVDAAARVAWDGGLFTVMLTALTDPPTDCVAIGVNYRMVQA